MFPGHVSAVSKIFFTDAKHFFNDMMTNIINVCYFASVFTSSVLTLKLHSVHVSKYNTQ